MQRAAGGFKLGVKKNIEVKIFILLYFHKIQQGLRIFFVIELWAPSGFGGSQPSQSIAGGRSVETSVRG